jgi:hypothetical protein
MVQYSEIVHFPINSIQVSLHNNPLILIWADNSFIALLHILTNYLFSLNLENDGIVIFS